MFGASRKDEAHVLRTRDRRSLEVTQTPPQIAGGMDAKDQNRSGKAPLLGGCGRERSHTHSQYTLPEGIFL